MIGRVVSTKMKKTAVVLVNSIKTHPLYKKSYKRSKKFLVHDENGVTLGDLVEIVPTRPISRKKFWEISKVVGRQYEEVAKEELKQAAREAIEEVLPAGRQVMPEEKETSDISPASPAGGLQSSDKEMEAKDTNKKTIRKKKGEV